MSNYNKVKITQKEINDIYEITKDEPYPPVKVVPIKEATKEETEAFLTEEEQIQDTKLFQQYPIPDEEETESEAALEAMGDT